MLHIQKLPNDVLEVKPVGKLQESDFTAIAGQVDRWTEAYGRICLLVDASGFEGWENIRAAEDHFRFVRTHHEKIERIAVIAGHSWQHWLASFAACFVHPQLKVFDPGERAQALTWLLAPTRMAS